MRYVGGKVRIAKWVVQVLEQYQGTCDQYLEPFLGSAAVFSLMAPKFQRPIGADSHQDLMLMWQAIQQDWDPPRHVSKEDYAALRVAAPSALRGLVGFGSSFSGKWFGGYTDSVWDAHHKRMTKPYLNTAVDSLLKVKAAMKHAHLRHADYTSWNPTTGWLVYCDPPYQDTHGYAGAGGFDSSVFWRTAEDWAKNGATVLVSESSAPSGWVVVAERTRKAQLRVAVRESNQTRREAIFMLGAVK